MNPIISEHMSPLVHHVAPRTSLTEAKALMHEHGIRHLPVLEQGRVVGMITMSDLYVLESMLAVDTDDLTVGDTMSDDLFTVQADTALAEVARGMAERHVGSAVILNGGDPVGIFTATDGLRALARVLDTP